MHFATALFYFIIYDLDTHELLTCTCNLMFVSRPPRSRHIIRVKYEPKCFIVDELASGVKCNLS
jgi:hypothetical protein